MSKAKDTQRGEARRAEREPTETTVARGGLFDVESPMAIELRRIMIRVGRQLDLDRKRTILVTSAARGEGKSLFSLHFSLVLAFHLPKRVLLLDGDIRRPVQHTVFQSTLAPGFSDLLKGEVTVEKAVRPTKVKNLDFMPAGEVGGRPSRLFGAHRIRAAIDQLQQAYDLVILDSPPVVPVSDPLHFLEAVDGVIYLVMAGQTPKELSKRGIEILQGAGANILGAVANNLAEVLPYYYDQKYYGYEGSRKKRRA